MPRMIAAAPKQNIADRTGNHISSLSDFKIAKLCPSRSQLRESVSMRFSPILESAIQASTGRSQQIVLVHVNDCPHNREPALVPAHIRSQLPLNLNVNSCIVFAQSLQSPQGSHVNCIADCPTCVLVQTEVSADCAVWADGGLCARPQRELPGESERSGVAALPAVQMVVVAAWNSRSLRVCACPHAVLRPAAPALCEIASCVRKGLCCRRVHRRSDGDLYPGNSTPHGSSAVFHHGRRDPWHVVDADHRDRLCVDPQAKDSAAPSVDDPQLF